VNENVLWAAVDSIGGKLYGCVYRISSRKGKLELRNRDHQILKSMEVPLAFGAIFGPDIDDVKTWNLQCSTWIAELEDAEKQKHDDT